MAEGSSSKSATAGKNATQSPPKTIKKQRSLKSLFSFFKSLKQDRKSPSIPESHYPNNRPFTKALGLSTASLPAQTSMGEDEDDENPDYDSPRTIGHWHSTTSLPSQVRPPFARHSPTSSSSSASSFEFPSDASTAATSPSNSSPSVLIKSLSSASVVIADPATSVVSSMEHNSPPIQPSAKSPKMTKTSKRVSDNYQKQPSPLSSVMDAHSPYTPQMSTQDHQPKRRSYLGNLLRRSQSHPDLADLTQADLPPLPPMPMLAPSSRPTTPASSISRAKSFRKKFADPKKSGGFGGYTDQEKIERISILGADPAGYGYYLYPTSEKEASNKRNSGTGPPGRPGYVGDWKRDNWGSRPDGPGGGRGNNGAPRAWKDSRGRGFRKTVAPQAIPEEAGDVFDSESKPNRRFSNPTLAESVSAPEEKKERRQSLHNSWDLIQAHQKTQELSSLQVSYTKTEALDQDDEAVLRGLQQGALRVMDAADSVVGEFDGNITSLPSPNTRGSGMKDNLPMIRIDMVEA